MLCGMPQLAQFDKVRLTKTLDKQHGIIARRQAFACGMTTKAVRYRIRPDGPWQVVLPGVYSTANGRLADDQRAVAAFLYAGRAIAITGTLALAWHEIPAQRREVVDVLVPLRNRRSDAGFARLQRTTVMPGIDYKDGVVSYVPPDRAIADTARQLTDMSEVRELVAAGVQRGKVAVWQIMRELNLGPAAGSARLRVALAEVADGVRSTAEADLRTIVKHARLPEPLYNRMLFIGEEFLAKPDAWWPEFGVAAEVDSKAWHLTPASWEQTLARHARMTACGILVLHFTPQRLRTAGYAVVRDLRLALAASRGPLPRIRTGPVA